MDRALQVTFAPLVLEPKTFNVGDTVRVTASFVYTSSADTTIIVQAGPYHYVSGTLERITTSFGATAVYLPMTLTPTEKQFTVDFILSGINPGTYGLIVEVPGTNISAKQDDVIIVSGAPSAPNLYGVMGTLLGVGLMAAMIPAIIPAEE
jgi:hypothetical protein